MIKRAFNLRRPREKTVLFSKVSRISHHESDNTEAEPTQDKEKDVKSAKNAWEKSKELIRNPEKKLVLLDEINIALRYEYLKLDDF